ncbi:MAG TPA: cupredoxin domain-containing protein [Dehalococcoidia bacterium]|jgi:plastocyanin|nr:cupredoxin domain-containing protein [Dehalococcoidia bacterium]
MRTRLLVLAFAVLAAAALLTAACGGDDDDSGGTATQTTSATNTGGSGEAKDVTINASGFAFDTTSITAKAGQTVNITLKNGDGTEHSFTVGDTDVTEAEGGDEGSGSFVASSSTTEFHCKYHPTTMKGTITVS